jgi:LCP family protein required for cell wall assembly
MDEWPEGWFRGDKGAGSGGAADDKTVGIPPGHPGGQYHVRQYQAGQGTATGRAGAGQPGAGERAAAPPGTWPSQPPPRSAPGQASPSYAPSRTGGTGFPGPPRWHRWLRPGRIFATLVTLVAVLIVAVIGTYFYLNSKLNRADVLTAYAGRPAPGSGTNWLIAGSDSRQGLSKAEEHALSTGSDTGSRSDTILVLHIPSGGGRPLLISIPRDSYVNIPGHGMNKINAAYAFGGPALLAQTIQADTGLYINHFMQIGFGGFVQVVNDVGGVRLCLQHRLHDAASGVHLKKGCHVLTGIQALAYVRDRHNFATQDLQREQDQRIFLRALLTKMTSAGVMYNPFKALPAASATVAALTVDQGTSLYNLVGVAKAMRNPLTTTVPIANSNYPTAVGDAVLWSSQAKTLWTDLQSGQPVPASLITGSHQAA